MNRGGGAPLTTLKISILLVVLWGASPLTMAQPEPKIAMRSSFVHGVILKQVTPTYPAEARTRGLQGMVRISVRVDKNGAPQRLRVLSGPPELVKASLEALKEWRYKPYKLNGKTVPFETSVDINYLIPPDKPVSKTPKH